MINLYVVQDRGLVSLTAAVHDPALIEKAHWIDLFAPTPDEEALLEKALGIDIPTREEMRDISESARLYSENGALFLTALVVAETAGKHPVRTEVTFILTKTHLITVRYADPLPFKTFEQKCSRHPELHMESDQLFVSLIEQIVDRIADVLEKVTTDLDDIANMIFSDRQGNAPQASALNASLQMTVKQLGLNSVLLAKLRESLLSFQRLLTFAKQNGETLINNGAKSTMKSLARDVASLAEYETQLVAQIGYLQEATFNLIHIDQNRVIKVFSVAAVLFLPPTLVGTVYGMNFANMPELKWEYGYPMAIGLMIASAIAPFYWFKRKGWL